MNVCIYIYLNHFALHVKLTQHCKSTILQFKKRSYCIIDIPENISRKSFSRN